MQTVWTLLRKLNKKWVAKHTLDANQAIQGTIKTKTETLCAVQCIQTETSPSALCIHSETVKQCLKPTQQVCTQAMMTDQLIRSAYC